MVIHCKLDPFEYSRLWEWDIKLKKNLARNGANRVTLQALIPAQHYAV